MCKNHDFMSIIYYTSNKKNKQEIEMTTYHHGVAGLGGMKYKCKYMTG